MRSPGPPPNGWMPSARSAVPHNPARMRQDEIPHPMRLAYAPHERIERPLIRPLFQGAPESSTATIATEGKSVAAPTALSGTCLTLETSLFLSFHF